MLINPLAIEFGSDFLYVGDGIDHFDKDNQWKRLTGTYQNPWEYTSSAFSVTIIFTSDGAGTSEGFVITCSAGKFSNFTSSSVKLGRHRYKKLIRCDY